MKDNSVCGPLEQSENDSYQCIAMVDKHKAKFFSGHQLGIEFHIQIDAWSKMEFLFNHQIKELKNNAHNRGKKCRPHVRYQSRDLKTTNYSMREKIE